MTIRILAASVLALALPTLAGAQPTNTVRGNRLTVGPGSPTPPTVGTVKLSGLGSSGGSAVLLQDGSDNIIARVLAKSDLPAAVAFEDEANLFTGSGQQIWRNVISETPSGADEVRIGVLSGTPRILFEDSGSTQWQIDNTGGVLRVFTPALERYRFSTTGFTPGLNSGYTYDLGAFLNKFRSIYGAELRVETLIAADVRSTIGGKVIVAPTTELTADLASAATSITVKHNEIANGDRLWLEGNGQVEFLAATSGPSGSGPYTYTVTRNLDGSGANDWPAGSAVVNTGTTGDGLIEQYADASLGGLIGPTIRGLVRTSSTYNALSERWAIGNLNGLYGYGATTYGAAFGNPSATNVTIDDVNGVRIRTGGTTHLHADTSGNLSVVSGDIVMDPTGLSVRTFSAPTLTSGYRLRTGSGSSSQTQGMLYGLQGTAGGQVLRSTVLTSAYDATEEPTTYQNNRVSLSVYGCHGAGGCPSSLNRSISSLTLGDGPQITPGLTVNLQGTDKLAITTTAASLAVHTQPTANNTYDLGSSSLKWREIYFSEPVTSDALFPLVTNTGRVMAKNDGLNGTTSCGAGQAVKTITVEFGIVTAVTCGAP